LKNPLFRKIYDFFKRKERTFFSTADYSISLTQAGKREILSWDLPQQPVPIAVIPCCADLELFSYENLMPTSSCRWKKQLAIPEDRFVLSYLGSIGTWYMLPEMLAFFKTLLSNKSKSIFLFITQDDPGYIRDEARKQGIPSETLRIVPAQRNEVPELIAISHVNIFFIKPVFSKKASSPTKQGEVMGMGVPIICNDKVGDTGEIIRATQTGLVIEDFTHDAYAQVVRKIDSLQTIPKSSIRSAARKYYALTDGINTYQAVYQDLLK